jgi:diaminohydroxyphosphoribosylaminopyrimidine deaminase/5-amino-6-(5-phosphoribosylamino)uracil reductase
VRYPKKIRQSNQPIRFIVGDREVPPNFNVNDQTSQTIFCRRIHPRLILEELTKIDVRTVLLESGPTLLSQFIEQNLIDELIVYLAPTAIGQGRAFVEESLLSHSDRTLELSSVGLVGNDLRFKVTFK